MEFYYLYVAPLDNEYVIIQRELTVHELSRVYDFPSNYTLFRIWYDDCRTERWDRRTRSWVETMRKD